MKIKDNREVEAFAKAAYEVLQTTADKTYTFNFMVLSRSSNPIKFLDDVIVEIMKNADSFFKILLSSSEIKEAATQNYTNGRNLFLFESMERFVELIDDTFKTINDENCYFLFYVHGASANEIQLSIETATNKQFNTNKLHFIVNTNENYIDLVVIEFYSPGVCAEYQANVINRFSKQKMVWEKTIQPITRIDNFYGCPFVVIPQELTAAINVTKDSNLNKVFTGYAKEILDEFANIVKINISYKVLEASHFTIDRFSNGTTTIFIAFYPVLELSSYGDIVPFMNSDLFFAIHHGYRYTDWEILLLAYDTPTWILIAITFAASFIVIFLLRFMPLFVRKFVFGRDVTTPALNILVIFFGLSQVTLPGRNFARFILTLFIIWALIIRTGYLGLLFQFMQGDHRHPELKTINEMWQHNFSYYLDVHGRYMTEFTKYY